MIVSSRSQIKTRSGDLAESVDKPVSLLMLRVGLGWACRRPRARPVFVVGVPVTVAFAAADATVADAFVAAADEAADMMQPDDVFGDMEIGEMGECTNSPVGVVG